LGLLTAEATSVGGENVAEVVAIDTKPATYNERTK
jgi:hypothetical protein